MVDRKSYLVFVEQTIFGTNNAFTRAIYKCECGTFKEINTRKVREFRIISCGCKNHLGNGARTHGMSKHPLYKVFKRVINRCYNENTPEYKNYGGRGVVICEEWLSDYSKFVKWGIENGWMPGLELDKDIKAKEMGVDSLLYSPDRCKFVTRKQNCNARRSNREHTFQGKTLNIKQWGDVMGISPSLIRHRLIKLNWSVENALTKIPDNKITGRPKK